MTRIYTPKEWLSFFRCPSIIIDDEGYIFSAEDYNKLIRHPIGRIDYSKNYIYGKDYNTFMATPIAYLVRRDDVIQIYEYGKVYGAPILYIQNGKIFTPDEYFRIFGGNPSGYVKTETPHREEPCAESARESNSGSGAAPGGGLAAIIGVALIAGIIYILSDEGRLANAATVLALLVNVGVGIYLLVRKAQGKLYFNIESKRFAKAVLTGLGVYLAATAVLVVLGLGSNIGTGNHISDQGGNQLELAAMLMGLPFVISGLFSEKPGSKNAGSGSRPQWKNPPVSKPRNQPSGSHPKNPDGILGYNHRFVSCPYCRKIFNAKFPAGVREIDMGCPECGRRVHCKY